MLHAFQKLSNERSFKANSILTLAEVISIRILCMHIISAYEFLLLSVLLPFKNCLMNVLISLAEF